MPLVGGAKPQFSWLLMRIKKRQHSSYVGINVSLVNGVIYVVLVATYDAMAMHISHVAMYVRHLWAWWVDGGVLIITHAIVICAWRRRSEIFQTEVDEMTIAGLRHVWINVPWQYI